MALDVYLLPDFVSDQALAGRTVIVIDILRATTTMTQALVAGARNVIPCLEVDEARRVAAGIPGSVLGGERGGQRIDRFDLGNSPAEYTPASVGGRTVVFTTTNGTRAMQRCRQASRVLLGTFQNLSEIVGEVREVRDLALVCAGTHGKVTEEDRLFAGAVVDRLANESPVELKMNDEAFLAARLWRTLGAGRDPASLLRFLLDSRGGRNLVQLGMADDVAFAARIDVTDLVAELRIDLWQCLPLP
jgi:2-phosphosulfolactate phosphatase